MRNKLRYSAAVGAALIALAACSGNDTTSFGDPNTPAKPAAVTQTVAADGSKQETQRFCVDANNVRQPEEECEKAYGGTTVINNTTTQSSGGSNGMFWFFVGHMMGSSNNYNPGYGQRIDNGYGRTSAVTNNYYNSPPPRPPATYRSYSPSNPSPRVSSTPSSSFSASRAVSTSTSRGGFGSSASSHASGGGS